MISDSNAHVSLMFPPVLSVSLLSHASFENRTSSSLKSIMTSILFDILLYI